MEASQINLILAVAVLFLTLSLVSKKKEGYGWPNSSDGVGATGVAPYIGGSYGSTNPQYYG
jgi:hypothetical protein